MFKLVIQDDEGKTTVVPLIRDEITIGRKEGNTIRLTERNVSRRHARILRNNGEVHIEDLGSYNGIRVNNARIAERVSLRVSDQVQIGDYKLYLKAEGLEQVDDAKTVPIERIDNTATDIIPAVAPAPTQPIAIPAAAAAPAAPQLVGNPARTLVAIADTDPNGRPIASPAIVASLSAPAGYGRLVVLSSNFAGKEFELSRPQMIVGRTDENDLVINHRSISRNHAKIVREPDSGRYTINDLQSSNGVRVNGQDYGKVELRRGDVVDLGHVRLRFVEPGEDFVFSRDAVITDVPDAGGKKGLMVAIVLGLIVLAGVTIFFLTRTPEDKQQGAGGGSGNRPERVADAADAAGSQSQLQPPDAEPQIVVTDPVDASEPKVDTPPDAPEKVIGDASKDKDMIDGRKFLADRSWQDAIDAFARAKANGVEGADEYLRKANAGSNADAANRRMSDALQRGDLLAAYKENLAIKGSVYQGEADTAYNRAASKMIEELAGRANKKIDDTCAQHRAFLAGLGGSYPAPIINAVRSSSICKPQSKDPGPGSGSQAVKNPGEGSGSATVVKQPRAGCEPDKLKELKASGEAAIGRGEFAKAMSDYDKVLACGFDTDAFKKAFLAACRNRDAAKAKYYKTMSSELAQRYQEICVRNGIQLFEQKQP
ncbi:MAG: FHA domain-containing protein [Deltaproteobacteria bacterium]|nr:FHA domain-containing protein [Deltaproteobacteria bacterium]